VDTVGTPLGPGQGFTPPAKDPDAQLKGYDGWDLKGRQSNYAHYAIGSDLKTDYKLGWGCWSAHKDLNSSDEYEERMIGHPKK
jgi:hypothetical protein